MVGLKWVLAVDRFYVRGTDDCSISTFAPSRSLRAFATYVKSCLGPPRIDFNGSLSAYGWRCTYGINVDPRAWITAPGVSPCRFPSKCRRLSSRNSFSSWNPWCFKICQMEPPTPTSPLVQRPPLFLRVRRARSSSPPQNRLQETKNNPA